MISVPESVAFYWGDAVNRAAINVLAGSREVPGDLTLAEAERFELANLAARRVRVEYWTMLRALWSATWGAAVRTHLPRAKLLTYAGHRAFWNDVDPLSDPSVDQTWTKNAACGVFELPGQGRLFTSVFLTAGEAEVELKFYLWDVEESATVSNELEIGAGWGNDGSDRRVTIPSLTLVKSPQGIDPEPHASVAGDALAALAAALR